MKRLLPYWPLAVAALILLGTLVFVTYTGLHTDSRRQEEAKAARQDGATRAATTHYDNATLSADTARRTHEAPLVPLSPTDSAGILREWARLLGPAAHPVVAPASSGSSTSR